MVNGESGYIKNLRSIGPKHNRRCIVNKVASQPLPDLNPLPHHSPYPSSLANPPSLRPVQAMPDAPQDLRWYIPGPRFYSHLYSFRKLLLINYSDDRTSEETGIFPIPSRVISYKKFDIPIVVIDRCLSLSNRSYQAHFQRDVSGKWQIRLTRCFCNGDVDIAWNTPHFHVIVALFVKSLNNLFCILHRGYDICIQPRSRSQYRGPCQFISFDPLSQFKMRGMSGHIPNKRHPVRDIEKQHIFSILAITVPRNVSVHFSQARH